MSTEELKEEVLVEADCTCEEHNVCCECATTDEPILAAEEPDVTAAFKGVARMEKKVEAGKKVSRGEAFKAMQDMRVMTNAMTKDFVQMARIQQDLDTALQHMYSMFGVMLELMQRKEVFEEDEFKNLFDELVVAPQKEAMEKAQAEMLEKMKADSSAAAEARQMPECKYCGKDDCEFCNTTEAEVEVLEPVTDGIDTTE